MDQIAALKAELVRAGVTNRVLVAQVKRAREQAEGLARAIGVTLQELDARNQTNQYSIGDLVYLAHVGGLRKAVAAYEESKK